MSKKKQKPQEPPKPVLLDLACGPEQVRQIGNPRWKEFLGVDISETVKPDVICDLLKFPWQWADDSADEVWCSHFLEHVPANLRFPFMTEIWRILKVSGKATIITPHWASERAIQDSTHLWPPVCAKSFLYYNKGWRAFNRPSYFEEAHWNGSSPRDDMDFDFTYYYSIDQTLAGRNTEYLQAAIQTQINAASDLVTVLTKRPKE